MSSQASSLLRGILVRWRLRDPGVLWEISLNVMVVPFNAHFLSPAFLWHVTAHIHAYYHCQKTTLHIQHTCGSTAEDAGCLQIHTTPVFLYKLAVKSVPHITEEWYLFVFIYVSINISVLKWGLKSYSHGHSHCWSANYHKSLPPPCCIMWI